MSLEDASQLGEVVLERGRRIGQCMLEDEPGIRRRLGLCGRDPVAHPLLGLRTDRLGHLVREDTGPTQIALVAPETLALLLLLDALEVYIRLLIVRRRVRRGPVADRLDERRPVAGSCPSNGVASGLVHR